MNPFLVIGGVAVTVATAAIGILAVPGWIDSAHDSAARNDLVQVAAVQSAAVATTGAFAADIDELEAGVAVGQDIGAAVQPSADTRWLDVSAGEDGWCAVAQSATGTWFARTSGTSRIGEGEHMATAAADVGCEIDAGLVARKSTADLEQLRDAIIAARENTGLLLRYVTSSVCTTCSTYQHFNGGGNAGSDIEGAIPRYLSVLDRISHASGHGISDLLDPYGRPYGIDENQGEHSACARDELLAIGYGDATVGRHRVSIPPYVTPENGC